MKKITLALAVLSVFAQAAQAQTATTVYGRMDIGLSKQSNSTAALGRGDNNVVGFKGTEDLGGGLSALFQAEMRFEPDTGTTESNGNRPLFQGQTRVGLAGSFGTIRLGRGLTAINDASWAYDPWYQTTVATLIGQQVANYDSDPLSPSQSGNRFSNAVFYSSPVIEGFQANATVATKEAIGTATSDLPVNPYSLAGTYNNGPISAMVGYERNAVQTKFWTVAGSYKVGPANLMASYSQQDQGATVAVNPKTKGWLIGADIVAGLGNVKVGYGETKPDGVAADKKLGVGYWYNLSKRTYLYTDAAHTKQGATGDSVNAFDVGIHHSF